MGKTYLGDSSNIAHNIINMYVGDTTNKARQIQRAYIGDENNVARMIYDNTASAILPAEYQQVLYIESTGTQYILTDFKHGANTAMEAILKYSSQPSADEYNGIRYDANTDYYAFYGYNNSTGNFEVNVRLSDSFVTRHIPFDTNIHKFVYDVRNKKYGIDNDISTTTKTINVNTNNNYTKQVLFAMRRYNNSASIQNYCSEKLYNFKWYSSGAMTANLYPCYRKADGVIGLYDNLGNRFYTNDGTGTFLKGPKYNGEL